MPIRKFVSSLQRAKERVETLENLSHVASLDMIISYGVKGGTNSSRRQINENVKYLPQHLKKNLLRAAFYNANSNVISTVISIQDDSDVSQNKIKYPSPLLKQLRELSDDQMFTFWLALFDEKNERKMGVQIFNSKFSMLLMTYLKQTDSVLEELFLNYNWFLKTDFLQLLCKMKTNLKELTLKASVGTESQVLSLITDCSQLKLRLFAFHHTPVKGIKVDSILAFLECQNQLEDLNVSHWIEPEKQETRKKVLDRIFSCCITLRRLRLHFGDLCQDPENLSVPKSFQLFVDFSNCFWGQAFQLPKASKLYVKNLRLTEDVRLLKDCRWTNQVVELDLELRTRFCIPPIEFGSLQKLLVKCLPGNNNASQQLNVNVMPVFPLLKLKEVSLFLYEETIDYKTFATILTESKLLERFILHLTNNNVVYGFDEEDFRCRLKLKGIPLKSLYLVCDTGRDPIPFGCLLKLIDKCKDLTYLTFNASPHQCQVFRSKGFNATQFSS